MNKLRVFSFVGGGLLVLASLWAALRYGGVVPYVEAALVGVVVVVLPVALAYAKLFARRARRFLNRVRTDDPLRDATFVSESPVEDPDSELAAIADSVRESDRFDGVRQEEFDDGTGLVVTHAGFHSSFVRLTRAGHLSVTGASRRTQRLVDLIESVRPLSLAARANNPLRRPDPVRGAPRVFLAVLLAGLLLLGVAGIANGAYTSEAYTTGEKVVFVSIDAQADADPAISTTDATLSKADFVVSSLEEETVEVYWESNDTALMAEHGRQSLQMSEDARSLLAEARSGPLSDAQAARADRIERDLHEAETSVADALTDRLESGGLEGETAEIRSARDTLRAAADRPA